MEEKKVGDKYILLSLLIVTEFSLVNFLYALVFLPILEDFDIKEKKFKIKYLSTSPLNFCSYSSEHCIQRHAYRDELLKYMHSKLLWVSSISHYCKSVVKRIKYHCFQNWTYIAHVVGSTSGTASLIFLYFKKSC